MKRLVGVLGIFAKPTAALIDVSANDRAVYVLSLPSWSRHSSEEPDPRNPKTLAAAEVGPRSLAFAYLLEHV